MQSEADNLLEESIANTEDEQIKLEEKLAREERFRAIQAKKTELRNEFLEIVASKKVTHSYLETSTSQRPT